MATEDTPPVARLQLTQPQAGFLCGSLPVPLDTEAFHDPVRHTESSVTILRDRPNIPRYKLLPAETDLNNPPSNWLQFEGLLPCNLSQNNAEGLSGRPSVAWGGTYLSHPLAKKGEALAVTGLAAYGDEIDVVAPADILKQIFKTPYSKAQLSIAVHRVGRTLILNSGLDADVKKVGGKHRHSKPTPSSLFSKFVHYSVQDASGKWPPEEETEKDPPEDVSSSFGMPTDDEHEVFDAKVPSVFVDRGPQVARSFNDNQAGVKEVDDNESEKGYLPEVECRRRTGRHRFYNNDGGKGRSGRERRHGRVKGNQDRSEALSSEQEDDARQDPRVEGGNGRPCTSPEGFLRVLFWQFQHLRMLLGSDLLLFSNKEHAAVSLRLVEVERQASPLHWLDAWLDNIMASVPELAVCYHRNGVVQGYELLKTDDIILLKGLSGDGNTFIHPHVVLKNASSVLQFLQKNCIRDPGTYLLRKNAGEDLMQLFDLTPNTSGEGTITEELSEINKLKKTRYSLPLAMLLYRLAQQLAHSQLASDRRRCANLFATCLNLLDEHHHPGVRASAHEEVARSFLDYCCDLGSQRKPLLLKHTNSGLPAPVLKSDHCRVHEVAAVEKISDTSEPLNEGEVLTSEDLATVGEGALIMAHRRIEKSDKLQGEQILSILGGNKQEEEFETVMEIRVIQCSNEESSVLKKRTVGKSSLEISHVKEGEDKSLGPLVICRRKESQMLEAPEVEELEKGKPESVPVERMTEKSFPSIQKILVLADKDEVSNFPVLSTSPKCPATHFSSLPSPRDDVSARLLAVHHLSQAIRSLRYQRHLLESSEEFLRSEGLLTDDPEALVLCICGETNCLPGGTSQEWQSPPEGKVRELIALLGDSYLSLGKAYKNEGQLGRALRAAELACLVHGSLQKQGGNFVTGSSSISKASVKEEDGKTFPMAVGSLGRVGRGDIGMFSKSEGTSGSKMERKVQQCCVSDVFGGQKNHGVGSISGKEQVTDNRGTTVSVDDGEFWGRLWCFVGDIYVDFQKQLVEGDIPLHEEATQCKELRISDDVVKEVRRLRKKGGPALSNCRSCSASNCTCLSDRASSGRSASSSNTTEVEGSSAGTTPSGESTSRRRRVNKNSVVNGEVDETPRTSSQMKGAGKRGNGGCQGSIQRTNDSKRVERRRESMKVGIETGSIVGENGVGSSRSLLENSGRADTSSLKNIKSVGSKEKRKGYLVKDSQTPSERVDSSVSNRESVACPIGEGGNPCSEAVLSKPLHTNNPQHTNSVSSPQETSETRGHSLSDTSLLCFGRPMTVDWEVNLAAAAEYYAAASASFAEVTESSQEREAEREEAIRKRGWVCNELGRRRLANRSVRQAEDAFQMAIGSFREVKDHMNVVLVFCNLGHGRRAAAEGVVAEISSLPSIPERTVSEKQSGVLKQMREVRVKQAKRLYFEALHYYNEARKELLGLGENLEKSLSGLWTEVLTQFGHTYLRLGMLLAAKEVLDGSEKQKKDIDSIIEGNKDNSVPSKKEDLGDSGALTAKDALTKALVLYETLGNVRRQEGAYAHHQLACNHRDRALIIASDFRQDRAFQEQKRGGTFSRHSNREAATWQQVRRYASLAEIHWHKALEVYQPQTHPDVFVNIAIERADLHLATAGQTRSFQILDTALSYLLEARHVWSRNSIDCEDDSSKKSSFEWKEGVTPEPPVTPETCLKLCQRLQQLVKEMLSGAMTVSKNDGSGKNVGSSQSQHSKVEGKYSVANLRVMYKQVLTLGSPPQLEELHAFWTGFWTGL